MLIGHIIGKIVAKIKLKRFITVEPKAFMNKAYLLVICLLLSSLTGCLKVVHEYEEDEDNSQIDETKDESDNTIDETNNTEEKELVKGCMNSTANNYNANATEEDNTCDYDLDDDGVLDADEILGCTNSTANNYNSEATDEDGTLSLIHI